LAYQSFAPGHPGFAVTLFVLVIVIGSLVAFRFRTKGDYRRARILKRGTKVAALAAAVFYLCGWVYLALKNALGF
jgi:hypothetical protein